MSSVHPTRALVLYHSRSGNTRCMAEAVAAAVGADLVELTRKGAPIGDAALEGYDLVLLGSPVRFGSPSAPVRKLASRRCLWEATIAPFCCYSVWPGPFFWRVRSLFRSKRVLPGIALRAPLRRDERAETRRAASWARQALRRHGRERYE